MKGIYIYREREGTYMKKPLQKEHSTKQNHQETQFRSKEQPTK